MKGSKHHPVSSIQMTDGPPTLSGTSASQPGHTWPRHPPGLRYIHHCQSKLKPANKHILTFDNFGSRRK